VNGVFDLYLDFIMVRDTPGFWLHDRPASNALSMMYLQTLMEFNDDGRRTEARLGYAGRINYDYGQKYLLELQSRYDGSSILSDEEVFSDQNMITSVLSN
jgi:hypothetical protein